MTEQDWLGSENPAAMLDQVLADSTHPRSGALARATQRKLRLFACACCREVWDRLPDPFSRKAVETAEWFADQEPDHIAREKLDRATWNQPTEAVHAMRACAYVLHFLDAGEGAGAVLHNIARMGGEDQSGSQAALARCIFGDPWRPVRVCPECCHGNILTEKGDEDCPECGGTGGLPRRWLTWNDGAVPRLARMIYDGRRWDELPLLADALDEAGAEAEEACGRCRQGSNPIYTAGPGRLRWVAGDGTSGVVDCPDCGGTGRVPNPLLSHLRSPGPHARGCWVVDLMLGKE